MRSPTNLARLKDYVDQHSGLALGDALNLSLFGLTIVSLAFAAAGLIIALVTYLDAEKSGKAQEIELQKAADSLASATSTLNTSKAELYAINSRLQESIQIAQQQQGNLESSVKLSSAQLEALHTQNAIALRAPLVRVALRCAANPTAASMSLDEATELQPTLKYRQTFPSLRVALNDDRELACLILLVNRGKVKLTNAYLQARPEAVSEPNDDWAYSGQFGIPPYRVSPHTEWDVIGGDWKEMRGGRIELMQGITVFPTISEPNPFANAPSVWLNLRIPSYAEHVPIDFSYGGDDQSRVEASVDLIPIEKKR